MNFNFPHWWFQHSQFGEIQLPRLVANRPL